MKNIVLGFIIGVLTTIVVEGVLFVWYLSTMRM
jgi:hypothetical protein